MSEINFSCPICAQHISCDAQWAGLQIKCPACEKEIVMPVQPTTPPPPSAPPVPFRPALAAEAEEAPSGAGKRVAVWATAIVAGGATLYGAFTWASSGQKEKINPPVWTLDLASAKIPPGKANGTISGGRFVIESACVFRSQTGWFLVLRQGRGVRAYRDIWIHLPFKPSEKLDRRCLKIAASSTNTSLRLMTAWRVGEQFETKVHTNGFVLTLEFGRSTTDDLPGQIFVALPDEEKTVVGGSFQAMYLAAPAQIRKRSFRSSSGRRTRTRTSGAMTMAREKLIGATEESSRKWQVGDGVERPCPPNVPRKVNQRVRACIIPTLPR